MMKVFVLINEQDTDASNQSTVQLFLNKEAAQADMRKQFKAELPFCNVDAENLTDDQECECGEDAAVIRNGPDSTNWRIEEQELDVQGNWLYIIGDRLREYSDGDVWSTGGEILCRTKSAADALSDMLEQLYKSQDEDVLINTGYYDPEEDKRNGEEDQYTGWWYVNIG